MTSAEARALIAEGRKHDEAIRAKEPPCDRYDCIPGAHTDTCANHRYWIALFVARAWFGPHVALLLDGYASALDEVERGEAWEAIARERHATLEKTQAELVTLRTSLAEQAADLARKDAYILQLETRAANAEAAAFHANLEIAERDATIARLISRIAATDSPADIEQTLACLEQAGVKIGELKLVIEQRDRDMARVRKIATDLREYLDDKYADVNRRWILNALNAILEGAPCTEATK